MNKKIALAAVVLPLLLAGCSASSEPAPTVTVTEQQTYAPDPVISDDDVFLANVRSQGNSYIDNASDADLLNVGHQTCDMLDSGYTVTDLVTSLVASGNFNDPDAAQAVGFIMGAGIAAFCPQYSDQVNGY